MLSAAVLAFAYDNALPATAPGDFQAGMIFGFSGNDVRDHMNACFKADQQLADDIAKIITAVDDQDIDVAKELVIGDESRVMDDASECMTNPAYADVKAAYEGQIELLKAAKADDQPAIWILAAYKKHMDEIKTYRKTAKKQWRAGNYYEAGVAIGQVDKLIFEHWENASTSFLA